MNTDAATTTTAPVMTALFPTVDRAESFTARITEPGWWATNVVRKGRTVTWVPAIPADSDTTLNEYAADMRMTVGYFGSDQRRKAKLNGYPCPMSY